MHILAVSPQLQSELVGIHDDVHNKKADALRRCESAFIKARDLQDHAAFIAIALDYALVIEQKGHPDDCLDLVYEALQLAQSYNLFQQEGQLLNVIGRAVYTRAEYQRAMQLWSRALEVSSLAQDHITWTWAKIGIAQIYDALEDPTTAVTLLREALARCAALSDSALLLNVHLNLGVNLARSGQYLDARQAYLRALSLADELKYMDDVGEVHLRIAELEFACGNLAGAKAHGVKALSICNSTQHVWALANLHGLLASIAQAENDFATAGQALANAIKLANESGSSHISMRLYLQQANLAEVMGDWELGLRAFKFADALRAKIYPRNTHEQLSQLEDLAGLRLSPGRLVWDLANDPALDDPTLEILATRICKAALAILKVPYARYWSYRPEDQSFVNDVTSSQGQSGAAPVSISAIAHERFAAYLQKGELIIAHAVRHHQITCSLYHSVFEPHGIYSALIVPVRINGSTRGMLFFEHDVKQHNWNANEVQLANQLGLLFARGIGHMDVRNYVQEIDSLNARLIKTNDALEVRVEERTRELSSAMETLVQTEKLASLGSLVAGFAHELNTPLGIALTAASTLVSDNSTLLQHVSAGTLKRSILENHVNNSTELAKLVESNAHRASDLISSLKLVAVDTASNKKRSFDLRDVIQHTLDTMSPLLNSTRISLLNTVATGIEMHSYPGSLEQVCTNLVANALKHAFAPQDQGRITIAATQPAPGFVRLVVEDNGCGIPEANQSKIFDPFFTTQFGQGGSGLGLYIVYTLVKGSLGGQVQCDSAPNLGTRFVLTLPTQAGPGDL